MVKQTEELWGAPGARGLHSCKSLADLGDGVLEQHWPE